MRNLIRTIARALVPLVGFVVACQGAPARAQSAAAVRVRVWCEGGAVSSIYPEGVGAVLADAVAARPGVVVTRGTLDEPDAGLSDQALDQTDALLWWGRARHDEVPDDRALAVATRVREGRLGLVALYASGGGKPFRLLMGGMPCEPGSWREDGRPEYVAVKTPGHPVAAGVAPFTIPRSDMFSEPFSVPEPDAVVFVSSWERGETVRSGMTWTVDKGRVVYLRAGSDSYPVLFHPAMRHAIGNAAIWAAPRR